MIERTAAAACRRAGIKSHPRWVIGGRTLAGLVGFLVMLVPASAGGQEPRFVELAGGYAFLNAPGNALPLGVFATGGWQATRRIALVGGTELSFEDADDAGVSSSVRVRTFLGGVQYNLPTVRRLAPFVQGLIGTSIVRVRVVDSRPLAPFFVPFDVQVDSTDLAARLGGGLTWWLQSRLGARVEMHYQRTFDRFDLGSEWPGRDANHLGVRAGAVIRFGGTS